MTKKKQNIKCNVESCRHNDCSEKECKLPEIKIGSTCKDNSANCKEDTICDNFEEEKE